MQIVTDSGFDLTPAEMEHLDARVVPHTITLADKSYLNGVDIDASQLYHLLETTKAYPTTSQPAPGDFLKVYEEVSLHEPDILSIHMSAGLSGTMNSVNAAVEQAKAQGLPAKITVLDTRTLSVTMGWLVLAASLALKAGWDKKRIVAYLKKLADATQTIFTLNDLQYLIHGGRISHIRGLLANVLDIKPIIGVSKPEGKYEQFGRARTFKRAIAALVDVMKQYHPAGSEIIVQVAHAENLPAVEELRGLIDKTFKCTWRPIGRLSPVMGAHTGPSMIGLCFAAADVIEIPLP